jgi:N-acetylglutamate synthase-like GNAT family acetyltransferase
MSFRINDLRPQAQGTVAGKTHGGVAVTPLSRGERMNVHVRPASLQDGVAVLELLEEVGYYPDPIAFAQTYRKTMTDPHFLVRVAEEDGKIVGMASLSMRYQLGLGGLLASLDELAVARGHKGAEKLLLQATVGKARSLGARRIVTKANEGTPPPRAAQRAAAAAAAAAA